VRVRALTRAYTPARGCQPAPNYLTPPPPPSFRVSADGIEVIFHLQRSVGQSAYAFSPAQPSGLESFRATKKRGGTFFVRSEILATEKLSFFLPLPFASVCAPSDPRPRARRARALRKKKVAKKWIFRAFRPRTRRSLGRALSRKGRD